jgi:Superinfection immunity protein
MFKLTFAVLVAGLSLALATAKAVETPLQNGLLDIIDKALAVHDYTTVLKYIDNSGLNYFGYPNASRAYVRGDILNDSRLYASCKATVYPSTFRRSLQGAVTTESAEEDTDKWEKSGKRVHTYSRFTITYSNSRPIHLISLNLTVLKVPKSDNEAAVLLSATVVTPVPNPTPWEHGPGAAKNRDEQTFVPQNQTPAPMPMPTATAYDRIVVNQPRSTAIPAPTLIQYSSTASSSASEAAPATTGFILLGTTGFILLGLILFFYFLPAINGLCNGHPHKAGIILLNFFLGWTLVGWVVALVWAVSKPQPVSIIVNNLAPRS